MRKKFIAGLAVGAAMLPALAFAQTTDIQSQIQSLLSQIQSLQQQLKALIASSSASMHADFNFNGIASSTPWMSGDHMSPGQMSKQVCITLNRNLGIGASGDDVKEIQQVLSDDEGSDYHGGVTGFFGPMTARAMANFQMHMGIASSTNGFVGGLTRGFFERRCGEGLGGENNDHQDHMMRMATFGTITANGGSSITIQTQNGSTTIVANITASTTIQVVSASSTSPATGSVSDLIVGKTASVEGSRNQDGSIQAMHIVVGILPPQPMMHGGEDVLHGMMPMIFNQGEHEDNHGSGHGDGHGGAQN